MNSANDPLLEIHNLLDDFENELSKIRAIWRQIEIDNPGFDTVSEESWQEKHARMWLHGATEVHECNELERWLYDSPSITTTANSSAQEIHDAWRAWLNTAGIPKWNISYDYDKKSHQYRKVQSQELGQTYYANDERFAIQEPDDWSLD